MRKKIWVWPLSLVVVAGLSGCNNRQAAENENFLDTTTGYHSTAEKDKLVQNLSSQAPMTNMIGGLYHENDSYSTKDQNYHGHASKPLVARPSYYHSYEGELVERLNRQANSVIHVKDARALVTKKDVLVTVLLEDDYEAKAVKAEVIKKVAPFIKNRTLHVTTDEGVYYRTMSLDNNLRDGGPTDMVTLDANDLFNNLNIHENHLK